MKQYLIRLDDACPYMDTKKWQRMEDILDRYRVKPLVGVIPHNEDPKQQIDPEDDTFWDKVLAWEKKGWVIAMHGYNHCYSSNRGLKGLNPMWRRSEFAGVPIDEQLEKIRTGVALMRKYGINPKFFFAPSHTFDKNTLSALREESDIRVISDTISTRPYRYKDFVFIPQFSGQCREMKMNGLFTFCFHPNTMNDEAFERMDKFLMEHKEEFLSFNEVDIDTVCKKSYFDRLLSWGYFTMRKLKGLY